MKRFHVHVSVTDLTKSVRFYTRLFGAKPTLSKPDYAKWLLADPPINFALSTRGAAKGLDHVGLQVSDAGEFAALRERLDGAGSGVFDQPDVACCYARSRKAWIRDPDGLAWEAFLTSGEETDYGEDRQTDVLSAGPAACC